MGGELWSSCGLQTLEAILSLLDAHRRIGDCCTSALDGEHRCACISPLGLND
jgi:hypothetical protein